MFPSLVRPIVTASATLLALFVTSPSFLHAQATGRVAGTAVQAESDNPVVGARVRVVGTSIATSTDSNGRFVLVRVPTGEQTIELSHLGRQTQNASVTIREGAVAQVDFSVPVAPVALEGLEALGIRAMSQAQALSRQQNAANIINVVAADQMGRFPDASAPEALRRVPGIAVETDQGEGRYVQIRGGRAEFTQINLNGATVPSPEGDERQVALDAVPVDILESIEVAKAITPDMDANAIGGAVNLETRAAPDRPLFSAELAGGFAPIRKEPSGKAALTWGDRFADGDLGLILTGSYSIRQFGSDDIEPEYDVDGTDISGDVLTEFQTRHYTLERERIGATASLDYRLGQGSELRATGTYTVHEDTEERRVFNNVIEDGELAFEHKNRLEELEIANATLGGEHLLGGGVRLDWGGSVSRSLEDTPFDNEIFFLVEDVTYTPDLSDRDEIRPNPNASAVNGPFPFDEIDHASSLTTNRDLLAHADLSIPYGLGEGATGSFTFGFQIRDKDKDQELEEFTSALIDGAGDIILGQDIGGSFDFGGFNPGDYPFPDNSTTGDEVLDFIDRNRSTLETEEDLESQTEDFVINERVTAGYVMTELNLTPKLMILPGVRYEHTDYEGEGFDFDPDTETLTPTTGSKDYDNFFPMAHVRYELGERTNLRAAYTTAISRPNFFDLVPFRLRDDEDLELGNPDLDPTTSDNFDLILEHYDRRIGVLSAGFFVKQLEDPIFFFVTDNQLGGETVQPDNGQSADVLGLELALQQQLRFLPAPFDGLGIYANYTWTDSEGVLPEGREAKLLGQADHTVNAALSYERAGFSGQLSFNFVDEYVDEYGEEAVEDVFVGSRHQLDFSASYQVNPTGSVFVELVNLTNEPFRLIQGTDDRPRQIEFYEPWGQIGFRLTR